MTIRLNPHNLRHCFATSSAAAPDLRVVQELLGQATSIKHHANYTPSITPLKRVCMDQGLIREADRPKHLSIVTRVFNVRTRRTD